MTNFSNDHHLAQLITAILRIGPWTSASQLPKHFIPGLRAQPVHVLSEDSRLIGVDLLLAAVTPALRIEYDYLAGSGLMEREQECIHDHDRCSYIHHPLLIMLRACQ